MKLVLVKDVEDLGFEGDVVEVKIGYARNYLLPRKLAIKATPNNLKIAEKKRIERAKREKEKFEKFESLAEKINGAEVVLKRKSGEKNRLFGSVTTKDIAEALKEQHNIEIDKKNIKLEHPLKELGKFEIEVHLYQDISTKINVIIEKMEEEEKE